MRNRGLHRYGFLALALAAAGCAGTAPQASQPMAAPAEAAPAPVAVAETSALPSAIEPGRFDTGKMWTFENAPLDYFEEAYGFRPTTEWLDHVRMASLRLPNCTASFVSADGLVMTNHHCARGSASAVSQGDEDLLTNGFFAATRADERRVPNLYIDQLVEMQDVTGLIESAVRPMMTEEAEVSAKAQRSEAVADSMSRALSLECSVTSLYNGGKYSAYCFKRYTDIRLVFIPELAIGYFGGDPDNFTYPRYVLDVSFLRIYDDDGNPYRPENYYGWSESGAQAGDAVFVIGNPGSTLRLNTVAQLQYRRDMQEPFTVRVYESRTQVLERFMDHHPEERPRYINAYFSLMNSLKLFRGRMKALRDPEIVGRKIGFEKQFRDAVQANPTLNGQYGTLWDEIADIRDRMRQLSPTINALSQGGITRSQVLANASALVEYATATRAGAPDPERERILRRLRTGINTDLDAHMLALQLEDAAVLLGEDDPFVQGALAGRTYDEAARAIIDQSAAVLDENQLRAFMQDPASVETSTVPAIGLMRDAFPRLARAQAENAELSDREEVRVAKLARALFEVYGTDLAPDATFTLRIADGVVQNYEYNGTLAPTFTTFYGMYDRHYSHKGSQDWVLPERWISHSDEFDLSTPLNMVSTNDITGGNSGSPVINTDAEIVGLIFDGNIESLSGDFIYTTETSRSVSVRAEAIVEALRNIYDADRLVEELLGAGRD